MKINETYEYLNQTFRVLFIKDKQILVINLAKNEFPKWIDKELFVSGCSLIKDPFEKQDLNELQIKKAYERYNTISPVLPFLDDEKKAGQMISYCSNFYKLSKTSIRNRLCSFLRANDIQGLIKTRDKKNDLTSQQQVFRWALNKYYYQPIKLSLRETYRRMIKDKFIDDNGKLLEHYPSFRQFNYFFYKNDYLEKRIISRFGKGEFQRNYRAHLGNGVRDFCPSIGYGMFDSTICDIYLVDDNNNVVGRPILTACVDGYSGMCLGYSLGFEGGIESLRKLLLNVVADKRTLCETFNIEIDDDMWFCNKLPHKFITDKGKEYVGEQFSQITDLGVEIINLPPFRPELKSVVEKFFDLIQSSYKKVLGNKGVIFDDYGERGVEDYRKRACITLREFEKIILLCIINYNTNRVISLPLELVNKIKPFSSELWNYSFSKYENCLIECEKDYLSKILLPRATGEFRREGLVFNGNRYKNTNFLRMYLTNKKVCIAYDPKNVGKIWLYENGKFYDFQIIDSFLEGKTFSESLDIKIAKSKSEKAAKEKELTGKIKLISDIENIVSKIERRNSNFKDIRKNRRIEIKKSRIENE